jgi:hypothetical protein
MNRVLRHPRTIDGILLLAVSIVVTLLWFNNGNLVLGGDVASIPFDPARTASRFLSSWNFWVDAGNPIPSTITNQVPTLDFLFYYSLHVANVPLSVTEGLYIVLFSYFLPAISTYLLALALFESRIRSSRLAGIVAGMFAILNPIYVYSTAPSSIIDSAIARASLPLALFLSIAGFQKRDLRYALGLGLSTLLMFSVFARATEIGFFLLIALALAIPPFVNALLRKNLSILEFAVKFLIVSIITFVMVNLFWIVPFLSNYSLFYQELSAFPTSFVTFESQFTTIQNVLRLQGYWPFYVGGYVPYATFFSNSLVNAITYLIPVIVIVGLFALRRFRTEALSLAVLLMVLIALGIGTNLPFGIFETIIQLPLLKFFKDPWIFLEALSLIYAVLFGVGISLLAVQIKRLTNNRYLPKGISFALALLVLSTISWPVLSGSAFVNWYEPSQRGIDIPATYQELNNWLGQDPCGCATMLVPQLEGTYVATTWGYQGPNTLYENMLSSRIITGSGANYGLEPESEQQFLNYVYMLMSRGDPLYSPTTLNSTSDLQSWHFSVENQTTTDSLTTTTMLDPWNQTSLEWKLGPLAEGAQDGHAIYYHSDNATDLSPQHWMLLWASSAIDYADLWFGVGYGGSQVGWYEFSDHVLLTMGSWTLLALPVAQPDTDSFPPAEVTNFFIDYGLYLGAQAASQGSGTIFFGPVSLSTGYVSQNLIQFLLGQLNVKYIVMDESIQSSLYPSLNATPYKTSFANWTQIVPVKTFQDLTVYENPLFGSLVSIPSKWVQVSNLDLVPETLSQTPLSPATSAFVVGNRSDTPLNTSNATIESFTQDSPTSFIVRVNAFGSFLLVLSTAFDSRWGAVAEGGLVNTHIVADAYANGWIVSGSGEMTIRIDYGPQALYATAVYTSIASVLVVLSILVIGVIRNNRTKRLHVVHGITKKVDESACRPGESALVRSSD